MPSSPVSAANANPAFFAPPNKKLMQQPVSRRSFSECLAVMLVRRLSGRRVDVLAPNYHVTGDFEKSRCGQRGRPRSTYRAKYEIGR